MVQKRSLLIIVFVVLIFFKLPAQSPCYLVILGTNEKEYVRIVSPQFLTNGDRNIINSGYTLFANPNNALDNAQKTRIEIKPHNSRRFHKVQLNIPVHNGCHLLLVRDLNLHPPLYFRAEWISQEMMNEYSFPGSFNRFDTALFCKKYNSIIAPPAVTILYKNQIFNTEFIRSVNPFSGQEMQLVVNIAPEKDAKYQAELKAAEISFSHPDLSSIDSEYIISRPSWPQSDSKFYWPNDFTIKQGTKITFKFLYWYKDGYEIKESGMITQTLEF